MNGVKGNVELGNVEVFTSGFGDQNAAFWAKKAMDRIAINTLNLPPGLRMAAQNYSGQIHSVILYMMDEALRERTEALKRRYNLG